MISNKSTIQEFKQESIVYKCNICNVTFCSLKDAKEHEQHYLTNNTLFNKAKLLKNILINEYGELLFSKKDNIYFIHSNGRMTKYMFELCSYTYVSLSPITSPLLCAQFRVCILGLKEYEPPQHLKKYTETVINLLSQGPNFTMKDVIVKISG